MMYRSGSIEYYEGSFQAVRLPYGETGRTAMYLFLPPGGESIAAFAGRFEEIAGEAFGNFRASEGEVWIPRLDVTFKATLNEPLRRLGMGVAFDPASADFSRMFAGARPGDFYIGDVLHQTVLKVDETGTEAAAVTSIEVRLTSVPVRRFSFKADRPFLLAIRDDENSWRGPLRGCDQRSGGNALSKELRDRLRVHTHRRLKLRPAHVSQHAITQLAGDDTLIQILLQIHAADHEPAAQDFSFKQ